MAAQISCSYSVEQAIPRLYGPYSCSKEPFLSQLEVLFGKNKAVLSPIPCRWPMPPSLLSTLSHSITQSHSPGVSRTPWCCLTHLPIPSSANSKLATFGGGSRHLTPVSVAGTLSALRAAFSSKKQNVKCFLGVLMSGNQIEVLGLRLAGLCEITISKYKAFPCGEALMRTFAVSWHGFTTLVSTFRSTSPCSRLQLFLSVPRSC